jgi:hypothetical protein
MKAKLRALIAVVALVAGIGIAQVPFAGSALATAYNCHTAGTPISNPTTVSVICYSGSGQYRIEIECRDGINGVIYTVYGVWVYPNHYSTASCPAPQRQTLNGYEIQYR